MVPRSEPAASPVSGHSANPSRISRIGQAINRKPGQPATGRRAGLDGGQTSMPSGLANRSAGARLTQEARDCLHEGRWLAVSGLMATDRSFRRDARCHSSTFNLGDAPPGFKYGMPITAQPAIGIEGLHLSGVCGSPPLDSPTAPKKTCLYQQNNLTTLFLSVDCVFRPLLESAQSPKTRDNPNPLPPPKRPCRFHGNLVTRQTVQLATYQSRRIPTVCC